jgi:dihydroflavonol-4-reductase
MKALVTGASGHLGANLIRELISRGWNVKALVHSDTRALDGLKIEQVKGDILDRESLEKAFIGVDMVFHLAARISVVAHDHAKVEDMNIRGVRNVVDACLSTGVKRLIHTSSFHAQVQEPLDEIFDETRPLVNPLTCPPYNRSKAEGELVVQSCFSKGLDAVIVTPSGIIGPYDYQPSHFGKTILNLAERKLRILVDAGLDWVDARDVATGMILAGEKAKSGEKYLLCGNRASLKEIALLIADHMHQTPQKIILPLSIARTFAPVASTFDRMRGKRQLFTPISLRELDSNRCLSHEKASRELGYQPRPLKDTINDTLNWFQANGYLKTPGEKSK